MTAKTFSTKMPGKITKTVEMLENVLLLLDECVASNRQKLQEFTMLDCQSTIVQSKDILSYFQRGVLN